MVLSPYFNTRWKLYHGDNTQIAIHRYLIAGIDQLGGAGDSGDTGEAVFTGNNGAMSRRLAAQHGMIKTG